MKKTIGLFLFILMTMMVAVSCTQDVTVDAGVYEDNELGTFVVNGKEFATLQGAVDYINGSKAISESNTIYLTRNANGPGASIQNSEVCIDFQNFTYSFTNVTGKQGEDVKGKKFGLSITDSANVSLKGLEEVSLYDSETNLTMVYIEGNGTSLVIEDAPRLIVEDDQYVFWAANGASLTIGTKESENTFISGNIAATGNSDVNVGGASSVSGKVKVAGNSSVVFTSTSEDSSISIDKDSDSNITVANGSVTINESVGEDSKIERVGQGSVSTDNNNIEINEDTTTVAIIGAKKYGTLQEAVSAATSGQTVLLVSDATESIIEIGTGKNISIDLGTKTFNGTLENLGELVISNGSVLGSLASTGTTTIKNGTFDSIEVFGGTTKVLNANVDGAVAVIDGLLEVSGGSFDIDQYYISEDGEAILSGGTYTIDVTSAAIDGSLDIRGGVFNTSNYYGILLSDYSSSTDTVIRLTQDITLSSTVVLSNPFTLDLNGHTLKDPSGNGENPLFDIVDDATLVVEGTTAGSKGIGRFNVGGETDNNGNLIINGGTYECASQQTVIRINETCTDSNVILANATITSPDNIGVELNGTGNHSITDCTISGKTAVYIKAENVAINGGTFISTAAEATEYTYSETASHATGDAVVVDSCGLNGITPAITLTGSPVFETASEETHDLAVYHNNVVSVPTDGLKITEATIDTSSYSGEEEVYEEFGFWATADSSWNPYAAINTVQNTGHISFRAAVEKSKDGDNIVLFEDSYYESPITGKQITVNENGHTLTIENEGTRIDVGFGTIVMPTIKPMASGELKYSNDGNEYTIWFAPDSNSTMEYSMFCYYRVGIKKYYPAQNADGTYTITSEKPFTVYLQVATEGGTITKTAELTPQN